MKKSFVLPITILFFCVSSLCFASEGAKIKESETPGNPEKNLKPKQGDKFKNSIGMEFVYIEPGEFMMGSPATESDRDKDEKQHKVTLTKGFWMQTTEVTKGQWKAVMGTMPWKDEEFISVKLNYKCPAAFVSWKDAKAFCEKLSKKRETYRLPTEAEWEYACRAGSKTKYYWGARFDGRYAWYAGNSREIIHAVGTKEPNKWSLYDMAGNVEEFCEDCYDREFYDREEAKKDPCNETFGDNFGDKNFRIIRGGSCIYDASDCRSAHRFARPPDFTDEAIGFRVVRTFE